MEEKKNNKGLIWIIVILLALVLGLVGYVVYDKVLSRDKGSVNNSETATTNTTTTKIEENENCDKSYSMMYNDKYIYEIKVSNKNGAPVYDSEEKYNQNIVEKLEYGEKIGVVADVIDLSEFYKTYQNERNLHFKAIEEYYYFAIDVCGEPRYVKYSDIEIVEDSIIAYSSLEKSKFYITNDIYMYRGPGLSFETNDETMKINKGTIIDVNKYNRIGSATWLNVDINGTSGWILVSPSDSVNYPYNNVKYGNALEIESVSGELYLENEENLYKYILLYENFHKNDNIILKIPKGTKIKYDYRTTDEPGEYLYHVNYNGNNGWLVIPMGIEDIQ